MRWAYRLAPVPSTRQIRRTVPTSPLRAVCLHGHFYQPPREDPWLGVVEPQASAAPDHDWNVRVSGEC
jgi:hypothetical protein